VDVETGCRGLLGFVLITVLVAIVLVAIVGVAVLA
jgi:type II secretory pathway component PulJ